MQKAKAMQYAMAGVQDTPGMKMHVQSHVRVPDAEAGSEMDQNRKPFYAEGPGQPISRRRATVPANIGVLFLCTVFVVFSLLVLNKACRRAEIAKDISAMETSISETVRSNSQLRVEVAKARDSGRICYIAAQELGMVASTGVDPVKVTAPSTRPFAQQNQQTGNSPFSVSHDMMAGSR